MIGGLTAYERGKPGGDIFDGLQLRRSAFENAAERTLYDIAGGMCTDDRAGECGEGRAVAGPELACAVVAAAGNTNEELAIVQFHDYFGADC